MGAAPEALTPAGKSLRVARWAIPQGGGCHHGAGGDAEARMNAAGRAIGHGREDDAHDRRWLEGCVIGEQRELSSQSIRGKASVRWKAAAQRAKVSR